MIIRELIVYPIKSLRGVSLESALVEKRGLRYDRRWMLVDSEGLFLTQRKLHQLALFDTHIIAEGLTVSFRGSSITVPFQAEGDLRRVRVWNSRVQARHVCQDVDRWFTSILGVECVLVSMPEETKRRVASPEAKRGDIVSFADSNPILVAGTASLEDLNQRLAKPITMRRFRPNIVVETIAPFEEDEWSGFSVGDVVLRRTKRCGRCIVTTIDIETALPSDEPLRTLATYRIFGKNACFGTYFAPDRLGMIQVGDSVDVRLDPLAA